MSSTRQLTEDFVSVSSVLSVADNVNTDSYKFYYPTFKLCHMTYALHNLTLES